MFRCKFAFMQQIKNKLNKVLLAIQKAFRWLAFIFGCIFLLLIVLSFTDLPYHAYHHLGTANTYKVEKADYIVLLGGGGMPGPQALLRIYYAAQLAEQFPNSIIVLALPADSNSFENSGHKKMLNELIFRGIDSIRLLSEINGTNTYRQAVNIRAMVQNPNASILIITSPEHMYRSILTFRKAGFNTINGYATFEEPFEEQLLIEPRKKKSDGSKATEKNLDLRYNMWNYLQYQIIVLREYTAIAYYKVMGYI